MAITSLTSSDTFETWFNTTNTIINTVNGITGSGSGITGPYVTYFNGLTGVVTFSNYVADFNGLTGSVTGVTGIIGSSGILISGSATNPTVTNSGVLSINSQTGVITNIASLTSPQIFTSLQQFTGGISASGATFSGNISAPNIVNSYNGITGAVTGVSSFNGLTGAVTGVTTSVGNNFTALQTFSNGITANTIYITQQCDINAANGLTIRAPNNYIFSPQTTFSGGSTQLITLQSGQIVKSVTTNTAATTTVSILEHAIVSYSSAEFLIQAERYTTAGGTIGTQTVKILMSATCGGSVYSVSHVEYGNVTNGSSVALFTVDTSGGNWRLRVTPTSSNTMRFRTLATLYPNVGGVGSGA